MRRLFALLTLAACACQADTPKFARARVIESLDQAIGGPTANAREGDFLLENDQIRAVIEQGHLSFLPTDVGGTLIDIDLVRPEAELRGGRGLDQLGQIAPMANLSLSEALVPAHVRITRSPNGAEVTTAAQSRPFIKILLALTLLVDQHFAAGSAQNIYTEYELRPGERMLRIRTTVGLNVPFCRPAPEDGCNAECDDILYDHDCVCPAVPSRCRADARHLDGTPLPDRQPASLLDIILGDLPRPLDSGTCTNDGGCDTAAGERCVPVTTMLGGALSVCRAPDARDAGLFLGDLLVFGGQLTPFVRGIGYDTETDIRRLFDQGKDTLSAPLVVDGVFATGDRISLGYASPVGKMLVPIFRGPFSLGTTHAATCRTDEPECLEGTLVSFERWVSVGEGDVASAQEPLLRAAGSPVGTVRGVVTELPDETPRSGVDVYALRDPRSLACDDACQARCGDVPAVEGWTLDVVRTANRCRTREAQYPDGTSAVESFARTDRGTDRILDGGYTLPLPPGDYVLVAVDAHRARSPMVPVRVTAGQTERVNLALPEAARLEYAIYDETAQTGPVKVTITRAGGTLLPLELGGIRPADDIVYAEDSLDGRGTIVLPPGVYEATFSRGPHYTIVRQQLALEARRVTRTTGAIRRIVDREGWISAGLHVHSKNSVDSGLPQRDRVISFLVEDVDLLSASDHDTITDYSPLLKEMGVADRIDSQIGIEITTQEYGHYLAYPLRHQQWKDGERLPGNGAVQWRGLSPTAIMDAARQLATDDAPVIVHVPHPYDYFDQYRVDPVTLEPTDSLLALINPLLGAGQFTGNFDVMELFNTKNFHRVRRATVAETAYYARGLDALIAQVDGGEIDFDTFGRRWFELATESTRRRLHRTVAEQNAAMEGSGAELPCLCGGDGDCGAGLVCQPSTLSCVPAPGSDEPPPADALLCRTSRGVIDDWFNMLNRGVYRPGVAGDDVHAREAGFLRTMVFTDGTTPPFLESPEIVDALKAGKALVTNGPMVRFHIGDAMVGDTAVATGQVGLSIRVEKAPWYDVDRIEIYKNGRLLAWANGCTTGRGSADEDPDPLPCIAEGDAVVAWDEVVLDTPTQDSWYAVLVYGLDGRTLAPVYESQVLAEIGTPEITQRLFTVIPGLQEFKYPRAPTIYPVFPFAFTNPIWVDVGGDGWRPPATPPSWCRAGDAGCLR